MKKIVFFLIVGILLVSCGKIGDPFYKEKESNYQAKVKFYT